MADDQLMLQQLFGSWPLWNRRDEHEKHTDKLLKSSSPNRKKKKTYKTGLFVEAGLDELLERFAVVALQRGRVVLWDEE